MKKTMKRLGILSLISCFIILYAAVSLDIPFTDITLTTWIGGRQTVRLMDGSTVSTCVDDNQWRCIGGYVHY